MDKNLKINDLKVKNKLKSGISSGKIGSDYLSEKEYLDEGKFAAPRWLVYPELDAYTIGWRMGYGEIYLMNEPHHSEEFFELFPKPQNWLSGRRRLGLKKFPLLGYFWKENGKQKYSKIIGDAIEVNDFITIEQIDEEFQYNSLMFKSIEHAILTAKYKLFGKIDHRNTSLNTLTLLCKNSPA